MSTVSNPGPDTDVLTQPKATPAETRADPPRAEATASPEHSKGSRRKWLLAAAALVILGVGAVWYFTSGNTVSTDDAFVSSHVTLAAPRVGGQIKRVLVEDNNRVHKGQLLVQLDTEPFQVQVNIALASVAAAAADLTSARAQARATVGRARSLRFGLEHAIQDVDNQIALLRARVAVHESKKAQLTRANSDYERVLPLAKSGAVSAEEIDHRRQELAVARSAVDEALQGVYQIRVSLGLPPKPTTGDDLTQVPDDLDQSFSSVRQAQASLMQAAAELGISDSFSKSPRQMVEDFYKRDPQGDVDRIYAKVLQDAPGVRQAEAKLAQANRALEEANLNLRYCDVVAEIDGIVTRRNVNPGNNVVSGQNLMAIRSLTEVWVDANFKETQLGKLRIGQPVDLDVDMYGRQQRFKGRISGFAMGTGSTLALLPAENATGNFVKVVQRLPVRIEIMDYNPDVAPLFPGLSVTPTVKVKEAPTGPGAGRVLQEVVSGLQPASAPVTTSPTTSRSQP